MENLSRHLGATVPFVRLVGASELLEHGCPRREQGRTPLEGPVWIEFGDVEFEQCPFRLAEIEACAGHRDGELDPNTRSELRAIDAATQLEGCVGATHAALAVDHERDLIVIAGDPTISAEFPQRQAKSPVA